MRRAGHGKDGVRAGGATYVANGQVVIVVAKVLWRPQPSARYGLNARERGGGNSHIKVSKLRGTHVWRTKGRDGRGDGSPDLGGLFNRVSSTQPPTVAPRAAGRRGAKKKKRSCSRVGRTSRESNFAGSGEGARKDGGEAGTRLLQLALVA